MIDNSKFFLLFTEAEDDNIEDLNTDGDNENETDDTEEISADDIEDSDQSNDDVSNSKNNNEESTDEEVNSDDTMGDEGMEEEQPDPEEVKKENIKRLTFFKNYKSVYLLVEDLNNKLNTIEIFNDGKEEDINLLIFIKEKSNKLLNNINIILKDKIETLDLKVLETVFINIKTEANLLVDLVEKVLKRSEPKKKKETIS